VHYKDLRIFKLASRLRQELYEELIKIPCYWSVKEVGQAMSSSSSSVSNIVEGFGRKFYQKEFFRFLAMSMASSDETQNHVNALGAKKHLGKEKAKYFEFNYQSLSVQILNMMNTIRANEGF